MTHRSLPQETNSVTATAYGPVDAVALRALQDTYDTTGLLAGVDQLAIAGQQLVDPDGLRAELLRVHAMAHAVLNGAPLLVAAGGVTLAESAVDLDAALDDLARTVLAVRDRVRALTALSPAAD
jgi:hypothetical protein